LRSSSRKKTGAIQSIQGSKDVGEVRIPQALEGGVGFEGFKQVRRGGEEMILFHGSARLKNDDNEVRLINP